MKRNNRIISGIQVLCLTLVVVIQYTISYVSAPTKTDYVSDSFMFMTGMLVTIMVVLEFCKEIKYSVEENYKS